MHVEFDELGGVVRAGGASAPWAPRGPGGELRVGPGEGVRVRAVTFGERSAAAADALHAATPRRALWSGLRARGVVGGDVGSVDEALLDCVVLALAGSDEDAAPPFADAALDVLRATGGELASLLDAPAREVDRLWIALAGGTAGPGEGGSPADDPDGWTRMVLAPGGSGSQGPGAGAGAGGAPEASGAGSGSPADIRELLAGALLGRASAPAAGVSAQALRAAVPAASEAGRGFAAPDPGTGPGAPATGAGAPAPGPGLPGAGPGQARTRIHPLSSRPAPTGGAAAAGDRPTGPHRPGLRTPGSRNPAHLGPGAGERAGAHGPAGAPPSPAPEGAPPPPGSGAGGPGPARAPDDARPLPGAGRPAGAAPFAGAAPTTGPAPSPGADRTAPAPAPGADPTAPALAPSASAPGSRAVPPRPLGAGFAIPPTAAPGHPGLGAAFAAATAPGSPGPPAAALEDESDLRGLAR